MCGQLESSRVVVPRLLLVLDVFVKSCPPWHRQSPILCLCSILCDSEPQGKEALRRSPRRVQAW